MFKNVIKRVRDNEVVFIFSFTPESKPVGLSDFDDIEITIGSETYSLVSNPTNVIVDGERLLLRVGDVTALTAGRYNVTIRGYDSGIYDDGYVLTSPNINPINKIEVI